MAFSFAAPPYPSLSFSRFLFCRSSTFHPSRLPSFLPSYLLPFPLPLLTTVFVPLQ